MVLKNALVLTGVANFRVINPSLKYFPFAILFVALSPLKFVIRGVKY